MQSRRPKEPDTVAEASVTPPQRPGSAPMKRRPAGPEVVLNATAKPSPAVLGAEAPARAVTEEAADELPRPYSPQFTRFDKRSWSPYGVEAEAEVDAGDPDVVADAAASMPKRPASAPTTRNGQPPIVRNSWRDPKNRLFSSLTVKVTYSAGSVTSEYGLNYTQAAVQMVDLDATAEEAVLPPAEAVVNSASQVTTTPHFDPKDTRPSTGNQAVSHFQPASPPGQQLRQGGLAPKRQRFTARDIAAMNMARDRGDFRPMKVEGKQILGKKPPTARGGRIMRSMKPPQAKRPATAPSARGRGLAGNIVGRKVDPFGRGLQSQLWVGMPHFPPGLKTCNQDAYPDFRLHAEQWAKTRNAGSSVHRRTLDRDITQPV